MGVEMSEASPDKAEVSDADGWREMYRIERAMRYMDIGRSRESAFRMADEDIARHEHYLKQKRTKT